MPASTFNNTFVCHILFPGISCLPSDPPWEGLEDVGTLVDDGWPAGRMFVEMRQWSLGVASGSKRRYPTYPL
jgi:hypothetical protein